MAQTSMHGMRAWRTASSALRAPAPTAGRFSAPAQHRRLTSASQRPPAHSYGYSLLAQGARPRPRLACPACRRPAQARRGVHLASLANATVDAAEAAIAQLHAVSHTPWYVTIPLVALGVNLAFRLPFSLHARRLAQRRARLAPLLQAWTAVHSKEVHQARRQQARARRQLGPAGASDPPIATSAASVQGEVMKRYRQTAGRVHRAFGVQQWKLYGNLLALPPWLVAIEAIRRMCGAPVGLLGMLFRSSGASSGGSEADTAAAAAADGVTMALPDAASAISSSATAADTIAALTEPSLAAGGCLWFPDLTVADPYHVLPFALSAVLVANVLPGTDAGRRALFGLAPQSSASSSGSGASTAVAETMAARVLQRTLLLLSVSVGFVTLHFPGAIHLYWLASAASSYLITHAVRRLRPISDAIIRPSNHSDFPWVQATPPPPSTKTPKQ